MDRRWVTWLTVIVIGVLGFAMRFWFMLKAGINQPGSYDDGVYFAAALSFVHGQMPYRDFLLLHPPGVMLVSTPFAWLAQSIGDANAFIAARVGFMAVGGLNAALVAVVLRRYGWGAALTGGIVYALSFPAIYGERSVLLETCATTCLLLALLALGRARRLWMVWRENGSPKATAADLRHRGGRWFLIAGLVAGLSVTFKIWYAPLVIVLIIFAGRGWWRVMVGVVIAADAVLLPFLIAAPDLMFKDVVLAQLGRPGAVSHYLGSRLAQMTGIRVGSNWVFPAVSDQHVTLFIVLGLGVAAGICALLLPGARVFVALGVVAGGILMYSPSFFTHYTVLTAMPQALIVGAAVGRVSLWLRKSSKRALLVIPAGIGLSAIILSAVLVASPLRRQQEHTIPAGYLTAISKVQGCVGGDDPTYMILANRFSKDAAAGCHIEVDPSGYGYTHPYPGSSLGRPQNAAFQKHTLNYAKRVTGFVLSRGNSYGLTTDSKATLAATEQLGFKKGNYVLYVNEPGK